MSNEKGKSKKPRLNSAQQNELLMAFSIVLLSTQNETALAQLGLNAEEIEGATNRIEQFLAEQMY